MAKKDRSFFGGEKDSYCGLHGCHGKSAETSGVRPTMIEHVDIETETGARLRVLPAPDHFDHGSVIIYLTMQDMDDLRRAEVVLDPGAMVKLRDELTKRIKVEEDPPMSAEHVHRLADKWQTSGWATLINNPPLPGAIPSIWAGQVVTDWLRGEAELADAKRDSR